MNIFTANQVNQVYVLKGNSTVIQALGTADNTKITKSSPLGSVGMGKDGNSIYFKHVGAGGITRSDLIDISNIMYVTGTPASKMARKLRVATVTIDGAAMTGTSPNQKLVVGQDYILKIKFQNPIGMSPDNQYWKHGVVRGFSNMSASDFYKKMALSLAGNMAREEAKLVSIVLKTSANAEVEVTPDTKESTLSATYSNLIVKEVEQDWIRGIKQQKPLIFTVEPSTINVTDSTTNVTQEVIWGSVAYSDGATIINSKLMADYEYFYMGERGDQYRMVNWPDYVPTTYLVEVGAGTSGEYGYDTVAIHYAYTGANHAVQKSEKDITFIVPRASTDSNAANLGAKAASILSAIKGVLPYTRAEADAAFGPKS